MSHSDWIKQTARRYQDVIDGATYTQCVEFARKADTIINYALIGNPHGDRPQYGRDAVNSMMFAEPLLYYPITYAMGPEWQLAHIDQPGSASRWLQYRSNTGVGLDPIEAHDIEQSIMADPFVEAHTALVVDIYDEAPARLHALAETEIKLPTLSASANIDEYLNLLAYVALEARQLNAHIEAALG